MATYSKSKIRLLKDKKSFCVFEANIDITSNRWINTPLVFARSEIWIVEKWLIPPCFRRSETRGY